MRTGRREFMRRTAGAACGLLVGGRLIGRSTAAAPVGVTTPAGVPRECLFYAKLDGAEVRCELCPHACRVPDGERGVCGVRVNQGGTYRTLVYDRVCSFHIDPIEKKPFYHYLPGTDAVSVATAGCNMSCKFCQNWQISQARPEDVRHQPLTTAQLVDVAVQRNVPTIAYTYSEPTIFYEYVHDTAKLGRTRSVGSVIVSNGFISEKPMRELVKHLTAVKVDLKAFTEKFYREVCGGALQPVLDNLKVVHSTGIHLEIVVLLIPTLNDGKEEIKQMCGWILKELGPDVPVHFSRFHPTYQMKNLPRTPVTTVEMARDVAASAGVHYAFVGNVAFHPYGHTYCPSCKTRLIERVGYRVGENLVKDGKCPKCATKIPGVWSQKDALAFRPK
ncbi:MAG TPA: AmmeMemoRadiSam system radical SAM enzyme [Planctomycetota bacterium]|nr:AmmeMemoRadiSam system radical SAM enzyme [Planctomycetota bacterium]